MRVSNVTVAQTKETAFAKTKTENKFNFSFFAIETSRIIFLRA
jgi:hypothetical protein